jgi:hypothetical protein
VARTKIAAQGKEWSEQNGRDDRNEKNRIREFNLRMSEIIATAYFGVKRVLRPENKALDNPLLSSFTDLRQNLSSDLLALE